MVVVKERRITNEIPPSTLLQVWSPFHSPSSFNTSLYPTIERDNHTFSPSCRPLISKIKTANDNGKSMLRSIAVKGTFTERSKMEDTERKTDGIIIFFASKFIASNKTMYNNFTRTSTSVNQLFRRA